MEYTIIVAYNDESYINLDAVPIIDVPNGKAHLYKYTAVVSAGQNEPSPFASKFQIQGKLIHKNVNGDQNTKYMKLHEIKHTVYNGADNGYMHGEYHELRDAMKDLEEPILVVYELNKVRKSLSAPWIYYTILYRYNSS